jgi:hypothetical protein
MNVLFGIVVESTLNEFLEGILTVQMRALIFQILFLVVDIRVQRCSLESLLKLLLFRRRVAVRVEDFCGVVFGGIAVAE